MIKYFCDHCGKELNSTTSCFVLMPSKLESAKGYDYFDTNSFIDKDHHLCMECNGKLKAILKSFINEET